MKKILIFLFMVLLITACSKETENNSKDDSQTTEKQTETSAEEKEFLNNYPKELNDEETVLFIDKYLGFWTAFELPGVEEVSPGNFEYDWNPQTFNIFKSEDGDISICYDITSSLNGNWYKVKNVVQENDVAYKLIVESYDVSYEGSENQEQYTFPNTWADIDYFCIIDSGEESEGIKVKTRFRENEGVYFHSGTGQTSGYIEWLKTNGFFVNDHNDPIENKIWPNGYGNAQANLYEAKQIIEDKGLVFDTNIPESEWNNPKEYYYNYIVDGKEYYISSFICKLGTTVFFSYY